MGFENCPFRLVQHRPVWYDERAEQTWLVTGRFCVCRVRVAARMRLFICALRWCAWPFCGNAPGATAGSAAVTGKGACGGAGGAEGSGKAVFHKGLPFGIIA